MTQHQPRPASRKPNDRGRTGLQRARAFLAYVVSLSVVSFFLGGAVMTYGVPPSGTVRETVLLGHALYNLYLKGASDAPGARWMRAHTPPAPSGAIAAYERGEAHEGLNLVVSGEGPKAHLITMDGRTVHTWHLPFTDVWPDPPHIANPKLDNLHWRRVYLYPNGDLLAIYVTVGDTPWGYGLVKIDKNSRLIWKIADRIHHDVDVDESGRIYTLVHHITHEGRPGFPNLRPPILEDGVLILSPEGERIKEISLLDAFENSNYAPMLYSMRGGMTGDVTHINTIRVIDERLAGTHPFIEEGQLLISMREMDAIAILDPETESITWAMAGMWHRQHDPLLLENGNILVFDNRGRGHLGGEGGASRVIEVDPTTQEIRWSYAGDARNPFYSVTHGTLQRLANGNTLITESTNGRAFEVTPGGGIVWEFRNPLRAGDKDEYAMLLLDVERVDADSLTFIDPDALGMEGRTARNQAGEAP